MILRPRLTVPVGGLKTGFAALRHRNYRLYWSGQVVSLIGTWMGTVTLPWLVLLLGGTPLQLGIVVALQFAPALVLSPFGGVLADRIDKRRALIAIQAIAMVHASIMFALTFSGAVEIWHVLVLSAVLGLINAADMPVRHAFAPELVPREDLTNAIALSATSFNVARVLGPAIAGVAIATLGVSFNFGVNAVSYLAVLAALMAIDPAGIRRPRRPETHPRVLSSLAEGIRYSVRTPMVLWPLVLLGGVAVFGLNFQTLLPLFARNVLALNADGYGALFAAMGVGSLAGSLLVAFSGRRPLMRFMLGGGAAFIALELLLGVTASPAPAFLLVVGIGFFSMLMINTINATLQGTVSDALRGRVMALYVTVFAGTAPLGGLFSGSVAQAFGAQAAFIVGGALSAAVLSLAAFKLRAARASARETAPAAPPSPASVAFETPISTRR